MDPTKVRQSILMMDLSMEKYWDRSSVIQMDPMKDRSSTIQKGEVKGLHLDQS